MIDGGFDKPGEQRMRLAGFGLELRMELAAHEPGMILQFNHLNQFTIR